MINESFNFMVDHLKLCLSSMFFRKNQPEVKPEKTVMEKLLERYVKPHNKVAKAVEEADIPRVIEDGAVLLSLCFVKRGRYPSAYAVAHPQIDRKKPLRFFVTHDGEVVINPVITKHSNYMVDSLEGCMSFPDYPRISVKRWQKCEVDYQTIENNKLSTVKHKSVSGKEAFIFQHENQHFDGQNIFNIYK